MSDSFSRQFVDTNILVYAHDVSAGHKHEVARKLVVDLWASRLGCLSLQVLQEFYVTVVQKVKKPLLPEKAAQIISCLGEWRVHLPDPGDVLEAIDIQQRNQLSFWEALIITSALKLDCEVIWTEDFNSGQRYEGVLALNPFSGTGWRSGDGRP